MFRRSALVADSFKEHYHRVHLPRRLALQRHVKKEEARLQREKGGEASVGTVPYKYNRWWVSNDHEFVHQFAFVEDPDVVRARRETLPTRTKENIWRDPQQTYFLPFAPYIKVVDYAKDPDTKFLKPINVPRWKDYMQRTKPVVPRTWY
ncbi:hypothetical protein STCU_02341 [Strigomonas culicis]|uniref:Uncharacterized protein n=1 Tax=Strigomonas culicis TaxID=28005 RepID=S9UQU4_9TRYP|nr:hypothetical protein STCU_06653 [Strigomonas culicis]EPY33287.1 hypothetical protein STCU_02341 [Strigomonas culicis]|eukprot:EPY25590.1 hypothetical protein STCU_06653 [Strigomonas culicis]